MTYHSLDFLFLFFPTAALVFHLVGQRAPSWEFAVLLAASLIFYVLGDPWFLPFLLGSISFNYVAADLLRKRKERGHPSAGLLATAVVANLILLIGFKFSLFPGARTAGMASLTVLSHAGAIPLGMSFYTLQQISFLVDAAQRRTERVTWSSYALYVSFFAQLVAGPIMRFRRDGDQFVRLAGAPALSASVNRGLTLFVFGLAKKVVLADNFGHIVSPLFNRAAAGHSLTFVESWTAAWGFILQLYFDFSAYSDMAVGIGLVFGLRIPINFDSPLKASSPSEFISRWHITLATFIRDYVFKPLYEWIEAHVAGDIEQRRIRAWAIATIVSLTLIGLWHGSDFKFIFSGVLAGAFAVSYQLLSLRRCHRVHSRAPKRLHQLRNRMVLLYALTIFGIFFRAESMTHAWSMIKGTWNFGPEIWPTDFAQWAQMWSEFKWINLLPADSLAGLKSILIVLAGTVIVLKLPNTNQIFGIHPSLTETNLTRGWLRYRPQWRDTPAWALLTGMLLALAISLISFQGPLPYIYGQF